MTAVLFVCTANRCRSPIAAALLRQRLPHSSTVEVESAGLLPDVAPVPDEGIALMVRYGIDLAEHRSRSADDVLLRRADLILAMTGAHVRALVAMQPSIWRKTFPLKEFVHRAEANPQLDIVRGGTPALDVLNVGRNRADLVGSAAGDDDVRDPMGESLSVWESVINELVDYTSRLADALTSPRAEPVESRVLRRNRHRR